MRKNLRSQFNTRQYMLSDDFEVFYYSDLHFKAVGDHDHDYYEFYFFLEGEVDMYIRQVKYTLSPGDVIIIPPGIPHHAVIRDENVPYRRFVFWISSEYCDLLLQKSPDYAYAPQHTITSREFIYHFDILTFSTLQNMLFRLLDEIHSERFGRQEEIRLQVDLLVLQLNRSIYEQKHPKTPRENLSLYDGVTAYIDDHLEEDLSLDRLASAFYVSKFHISHLFQDNTGLSVHQYILKKRLSACCSAMLAGGEATKVCLLYGFKDYSTFYRAFKKEYGLSPSEYSTHAAKGANH
ncbi:MAG: AraC family transcriptional regulator [Lachnospiraceae bacterium]|nr:AraC family transcriptional regulator [Lachnospiraceae bacterium]